MRRVITPTPRPCDGPRDDERWTVVNALARDLDGNLGPATSQRLDERVAKLAVGSAIPVADDFGQIDVSTGIVCAVCGGPAPFRPLQTWVIPVMSADGRFSVALQATRLDDCP